MDVLHLLSVYVVRSWNTRSRLCALMQMVGFSYGQAKSMGMLFMISSSVCNVHEISQRAQPVEHCITRGNRPVGRLADEVLDAKHLPPRCQGARTNCISISLDKKSVGSATILNGCCSGTGKLEG